MIHPVEVEVITTGRKRSLNGKRPKAVVQVQVLNHYTRSISSKRRKERESRIIIVGFMSIFVVVVFLGMMVLNDSMGNFASVDNRYGMNVISAQDPVPPNVVEVRGSISLDEATLAKIMGATKNGVISADGRGMTLSVVPPNLSSDDVGLSNTDLIQKIVSGLSFEIDGLSVQIPVDTRNLIASLVSGDKRLPLPSIYS